MLFFKLSAFYFFYFASVGVYIIFLPKVLHDIGYTPSDIGIVLALSPLMRFLTPFLFLKHIKLSQIVFKNTLLLSIISSLFFYFTIDNFYLFAINNALLGVSLSIILPYIEVIAIKELKNSYGKSRLYGSIGFIFTSLFLAKLLNNPYTALHFYFITVLLTAIYSYSLLKYDNEPHQNIENKENFSLLKYWPFWLSLFLMQVSFGGFYNFFTIYETSYGISLETTSYLWAFGVICEVLMFYYQAPLLKRNLLFIIKISTLVTIFRWLLLYLYPESLGVSFFTQSLHAFSFGLYHSAVILYLYTLYSNKKLSQQFMLGIAYGLGGFTGSLIAGWIYEYFTQYIFLVSAFIALLSLMSLKNIKK